MVYLGLYPKITIGQLKNIWATPEAKHWHNQGPRYYPLELTNTVGILDSGPFNPNVPSSIWEGINFQLLIPRHPQHILPMLYYTAADGTALGQPITNINQYVNTSIAEFTIGTRDINNDTVWSAYLRELDNMGLQQWLRIAQATYTRQR